VVLLTLATAADAYGAETDELSTLLDELEGGFATALADTQSVLARSGHVIKPAEDDEMGEILKRRPSPASMLGLPPRLATPTAPTTRTCWPRVNSWPEVPRRR
jgi:hypothetical protein